MNKTVLLIGGILLLMLVSLKIIMQPDKEQTLNQPNILSKLRYTALGDSYTYGESVIQSQTFPRQLTTKLNTAGIPTELTAVLAKTGWTTQGVIIDYLPKLKQAKPQLTTILIGVNDWVRGVSPEEFEINLNTIVQTARYLPNNKVILITIPDFSYTPEGKKYSNGRDITAGIKEYNEIVKKVGLTHNIEVVDIYPISEQMQTDPSLIARDNLHPSAEQYKKWVEKIYPVVVKELEK